MLAAPEHAVTAMARIITSAPASVEVLLLGPHTNLAMAVRLQPKLVDNVSRVVFMGGCAHARGNMYVSLPRSRV